MANINVTIRMDEVLKSQADELFSDFGLTLNAALNMFVKQAVREQRIPFEITRKNISLASNDTLQSVSQTLINENMQAYRELAK